MGDKGILEGIIILVDARGPLTNYLVLTSDIYFFCYAVGRRLYDLMAVVASPCKESAYTYGVEGDPSKGGRIKQYFASDHRLHVQFIIDIDDCDNLLRTARFSRD
jgi:hypothetical protein